MTKIINENGLKFKENSEPKHTDGKSSGVKFNEEVRTVNITPRNMGRKVEELHHKQRKNVQHTEKFVDLIEIKNRIEPVLTANKAEMQQRENLSPKSKPASRPPSGKAGDQSKSSPYARKLVQVSDANSSKVQNQPKTKLLTQARPKSAPLNRMAKPVATVTVDYGEIGKQEKEQNMMEEPKRKGRKSKEDVVTMMQQMSVNNKEKVRSKTNDNSSGDEAFQIDSDDEEMKDLLNAPAVYKSDKEKNYYEISRHSSMSNVSVKNEQSEKIQKPSSVQSENIPIVKTTKTLEFDANEPKEISVKSVLDAPAGNKEKEKYRPTTPEKVTKKPPSRPSSAKVRN